LSRLAERVGCAKSYLSSIENERRSVPGDAVLHRIEVALALGVDSLVECARWQRSLAVGGESVQRELARLTTDQRLGRRLAALLAEKSRAGQEGAAPSRQPPSPQAPSPGRRLGLVNTDRAAPAKPNPQVPGSQRTSLDEAYLSGELKHLIDQLAPDLSAQPTAPGSARAPSNIAPAARAPHSAIPIALPLEVPLINSVAAGYPRQFTDMDYPARVADEYIRCPDISDADAFAARVVGDSMQPIYTEGDIVVFSPSRAVKSGMDCFARLEPDHETTFKRIYLEENEAGEQLIRLQPLNAAYSPRTLPREQVAGLYAAVSVMRKIG